jgi:hypothetical protein
VVETSSHGIKIVIEHVRVAVARHRGGLVPEHAPNGLHVRSDADCERGGGVPEVVQREALEQGVLLLADGSRTFASCSMGLEPRVKVLVTIELARYQ